MDFQDSSLRLDESSRSDVDMTPSFRSFKTKTTLYEDLFYSLSQPYARTDVALVLSHGPVIRLHKWVLCHSSTTMKQRIEDAENNPMVELDAGHLIIKLPEHLHLVATVRIIFYMYLDQTIYSSVMKDAFHWFGIQRFLLIPFEQECYKDYEPEQMQMFKRYSVCYSMDRVDFLMDIEGKSTRFALPSNPTAIRLFCTECGMVFKSNEEVETHHVNTPCPESAGLKLVSRRNPALCCNDCGNSYVCLIRRGNSGISNKRVSGISTIPRSTLPTYYESFAEGLCHHCSPAPEAPSAEVNSTPIPSMYSPQYCFKCLQVFYTAEDEHDHEAECAIALETILETDEDRGNQVGEANIVFGKGALGNHQVQTCKIDDCGMVFVEASTLYEGIYQHSDNVHNIRPHKAFAIHPETLKPICLVFGIKKGGTGHSLATVGDFLKDVHDCFQAKKKKMRRNPPLAMKLVPEISIVRDLDASKWYQRLDIHTKDRSDGQNVGRKSLQNRGASGEAPQAVEPAAGGKPVNRKCKVAENGTGAEPAAAKKPVKKQNSKKPVSTKPAVGPLSTGPVPSPATGVPITGPVSAKLVAGEKQKKKKKPASSVLKNAPGAKPKRNSPTER